MVHPQAVDEPVRHQGKEQTVGGGEHAGVFHPHRDQGRDVEEPPPVQLGRPGAPGRQPVVLGVQQLCQRQVPSPHPDRQHMVEIPQHRPGIGVAPAGRVHREIAEAVLEQPGQDGQQETASSRRPVHVEPVRERRSGAVAQDRPQLPVE